MICCSIVVAVIMQRCDVDLEAWEKQSEVQQVTAPHFKSRLHLGLEWLARRGFPAA